MIRSRYLVVALVLGTGFFLTSSSAEARPIYYRQAPCYAPVCPPPVCTPAPVVCNPPVICNSAPVVCAPRVTYCRPVYHYRTHYYGHRRCR